eukprot:COSAG01_NODE_6269_length_3761_cov_3.088725_3_plen_96_part_00
MPASCTHAEPDSQLRPRRWPSHPPNRLLPGGLLTRRWLCCAAASEPCEHEVAVDAVAARQDGSAAPRSRPGGAARSVTVTLEAYAAVELVVPSTT